MADLIIVGRVNSVFGIQGWLNIYSYTDPVTNILDYAPWYLHPLPLGSTDAATSTSEGAIQVKPSQCQLVKVAEGRKHGKRLVAQFEGCVDRDGAQGFTQQEIWVPRAVLPKLDETYYWSDLHGLTVIDQHGRVLGVVDHLIETGANDVLVVKSLNKEGQLLEANSESSKKGKAAVDDLLIPFVFDHFIVDVDLNSRVIKVDWE